MKKLGLLVLLMLGACSKGHWEIVPERTADQNDDADIAVQAMKHLVYTRDTKTGLCFAVTWVGSNRGGPAMTNVPCDVLVRTLGKGLKE